ncbi:MAG: formyl transferase [Pseudomonadota bacterium]
MSVVAITGSHPRHVYLVQGLAAVGLISGWVVDERENFVPEPPEHLSDRLKALFALHFERREKAEERFFGLSAPEDLGTVDKIVVERQALNGSGTIDFLARHKPQLVMSYGCGLISEETIQATDATFLNAHGGLSPDYRGAITHFWPSYMLEPQMTGMTLHEVTRKIDGGDIYHQTGVSLVEGDGLHDISARAVKEFADGLVEVLSAILGHDECPPGQQQKSAGRLWTKSLWRPEHLQPIYEEFEDRIVDRVIDGTLEGREPKLISIDDFV